MTPHQASGAVQGIEDAIILGTLLDELERRGQANGVPGLRRLGPEELRELEPAAAGIAALHSPATGIVDFAAVARAMRADQTLVINVSGRGDKDVTEVMRLLGQG